MESDVLFNKVYTVAYRLTGQDENADELALSAITSTAREFGWYPWKPLHSEILQASVKKVCFLFLNQSWPDKIPQPVFLPGKELDQEQVVQAALLTLKPLERVIIVWRYVAGQKVLIWYQ